MASYKYVLLDQVKVPDQILFTHSLAIPCLPVNQWPILSLDEWLVWKGHLFKRPSMPQPETFNCSVEWHHWLGLLPCSLRRSLWWHQKSPEPCPQFFNLWQGAGAYQCLSIFHLSIYITWNLYIYNSKICMIYLFCWTVIKYIYIYSSTCFDCDESYAHI